MKYDSLRKLNRNKSLYEYYLNNPGLSYKEIGDAFNISRQRAAILIKDMKKLEETHDKSI